MKTNNNFLVGAVLSGIAVVLTVTYAAEQVAKHRQQMAILKAVNKSLGGLREIVEEALSNPSNTEKKFDNYEDDDD